MAGAPNGVTTLPLGIARAPCSAEENAMRNVLGFVSLVMLAACSGGGTNFIGPGAGAAGPGEAPTSDDAGAARVPGDEGTTVPKSVTAKLADDLSIAEIAVFQALKATIVKGTTKATPVVPIVAQRDALIRVYVKPSTSYQSRPLKAVLRLIDQDGEPLKAFSDTKTIAAASSDGAMSSTFNFTVPGSTLPLGVKFAVAITDDKAEPMGEGEESAARYPTDGTEAAVGVKSSGPSVRIVIVPIKYGADGSGRLPDTSAAQLKINRDVLWGMYPTPEVDITVRQALVYNSAVRGTGQGWSDLLQTILDLREQDNADEDVYYWGSFAGASSQQAFCGGGCVLGLSTVVSDARNSYFRASIGVGFRGQDSAETMAHEIGHAHGRNHAPCSDFGQIDGVDPAFPNKGAQLGVWGYDMISQTLINPTDKRDFMGYCSPSWVSDYTFKGLFDRITAVNKGKALPPVSNLIAGGGNSGGAPGQFQFVTLDADGPASFGRRVTMRAAPQGDAREVQLLDGAGKTIRTVRGEFFGFDHLPGGLLMVPETGTSYAGVRVTGSPRTLTR